MKRREFLKTATILPAILTVQNGFCMENSVEILGILNTNQNSFLNKESDLFKKRNYFLDNSYKSSFLQVKKRLKNLQRHIGYGNFNIISFDEMLKYGESISSIGKFTKEDLAFLEYIFYYDPSVHGFYGSRVSKNITETINKKDVVKVSNTGHFLFKGHPYETYNRMLNDVGDSIVLTSGIRSIVKQTKLFLDKLSSCDGNMSEASRSLAPPAFTYHSIADFDIGKKGFGYANFTPRFALTQEFTKMRRLKYIDMRYTVNNKDGVRYEPWHVKVI